MGLVSLDQARAHIGRKDFDADGDIELKLEHASAIILDYLKHRTDSIASISVANPAVITTAGVHGLVSGASALIAGTTTTPTVNGTQVVTVLTSTTFSVPVNVTVGQSSAAGTVGRPAWDEDTAPYPVQAAVLLMVAHLREHRGDDPDTDEALWKAVERLLIRFRDPALA